MQMGSNALSLHVGLGDIDASPSSPLPTYCWYEALLASEQDDASDLEEILWRPQASATKTS